MALPDVFTFAPQCILHNLPWKLVPLFESNNFENEAVTGFFFIHENSYVYFFAHGLLLILKVKKSEKNEKSKKKN